MAADAGPSAVTAKGRFWRKESGLQPREGDGFPRYQAMNSKKETNWFFKASAVMLVLTAMAKLYSSFGSAKVLVVQDELLHLGYRPLLISVALLEIGVAAFLIRGRSDFRKCLVMFWLSGNFLSYHLGNYLLGIHLCPCLGHLTDRLPLPNGLTAVLLQFLVLYWFVTSLNILWREIGSAQCARWIQVASRILHRSPPRPNEV